MKRALVVGPGVDVANRHLGPFGRVAVYQPFELEASLLQHGVADPGDLTIDWRKVVFNMLTIKGIYGREIFETWYKMTVMIQSGLDLKPVITHRLPYQEFEHGFETMMAGKSGKIILNWD